MSVILCAHGGAAGCDAAEMHAVRLRESGRFEAVVACCLRGMPDLAAAFSRVRGRSAVVVPMLMADGYTSRTVLPVAVANAAPGGQALRITPPLGTSPGVADIIARRAARASRDRGWDPARIALLIAGHGTSRDRQSGETVEAAAARLRNGGAFGDVRTGFLEQAPLLADVLAELQPARCVVAGYFADAGGHAVQDLPALIEAKRPDAVYMGPVGVDSEIVDVIIEHLQGDPSNT